MIYTVRFWRYGQWNYIPDEPVDSAETTDEFVEKYGLDDYQIMASTESLHISKSWHVVDTIKF